MGEENKPSRESAAEQTSMIKGLLPTNKAAALGLAVLFATSTMLTGCGSPVDKAGTAGWEVVDEKEAQENQANGNGNFYYGGYGLAYFMLSGRPRFNPGGKVSWSKPSDTFKSGGYGIIRGGGAAG
ncbi:MAG: hypothetical protein WA118_09085 [Carboxydocellales bacterium]